MVDSLTSFKVKDVRSSESGCCSRSRVKERRFIGVLRR